ncbi:MAG TPA: T9SS type A sorting domain-containing protein [Chitinophagaceae bacterium]|nr:T9SS type A sorting domain-containing protein [Chitinophagaceae bacterium]
MVNETDISTDNEPSIILGTWDPNFIRSGGFPYPYTQKPSKLYLYAKWSMQTGDSASIILIFRKNGTTLTTAEQNIFKIGGSNTSDYVKLEFDIQGLTEIPDTFAIVFCPANFKVPINSMPTTGKKDEYLIVDDIAFDTGVLPYGGFEEWGRPIEHPCNFMMWGAYEVVLDCNVTNPLQKTTDAHTGMYAMKAITYVNPYEDNNDGIIGSGTYGDIVNDEETKFPCTTKNGIFTGWYKYIPALADTAHIDLILFKSGNQVGIVGKDLYAASTYTVFSLTYNCNDIPDSAQIRFNTSNNRVAKNVGSVLYLDDLSITGSTFVSHAIRAAKPAHLTVKLNTLSECISISGIIKSTQVNISDLTGKIYFNKKINDDETIKCAHLPSGVYIVSAYSGSSSTITKIIKK